MCATWCSTKCGFARSADSGTPRPSASVAFARRIFRRFDGPPGRHLPAGAVLQRVDDPACRGSPSGSGRGRSGRCPRVADPRPPGSSGSSGGGSEVSCLMRVKRSSSTAATSWPSTMSAAEASPWYALIPRMFTRWHPSGDRVPGRFDSLRRRDGQERGPSRHPEPEGPLRETHPPSRVRSSVWPSP